MENFKAKQIESELVKAERAHILVQIQLFLYKTNFMISVFFVNLYFWIISNISSSTFAEPALSRTAMWHVICVQHSTRPWSFPFRTLKQLQQLHSNNFTQQCTRRCTTNIYYKHKNNTGSKFQCCYLFGFVSFKCSFWKFELWRRYFWAAYSSPGGATLFVPILHICSLGYLVTNLVMNLVIP